MTQESSLVIYKCDDIALIHQVESHLQNVGFEQKSNFQFECLFNLLNPFRNQSNTVNNYGLLIDIVNKVFCVINYNDLPFINHINKFLKVPVISNIDELLKKIPYKEGNQKSSSNNTFESALIPGRIIVFEDGDKIRYGFIIKSNIIVYVNSKGEIQGYLKNFTKDSPYKINRILIPTDEKFKLTECSEMLVAWKRKDPIIVKKTKEEIEKALGLEPGTLEIS